MKSSREVNCNYKYIEGSPDIHNYVNYNVEDNTNIKKRQTKYYTGWNVTNHEI